MEVEVRSTWHALCYCCDIDSAGEVRRGGFIFQSEV